MTATPPNQPSSTDPTEAARADALGEMSMELDDPETLNHIDVSRSVAALWALLARPWWVLVAALVAAAWVLACAAILY